MSNEIVGKEHVLVNFRDGSVESLTFGGNTYKVINILWELNTKPNRDESHYLYIVETPDGSRAVEMRYLDKQSSLTEGRLIRVWNPKTEIDEIKNLAEWSSVWITP